MDLRGVLNRARWRSSNQNDLCLLFGKIDRPVLFANSQKGGRDHFRWFDLSLRRSSAQRRKSPKLTAIFTCRTARICNSACSWAGICPANEESVGKRKRTH